MDLTCHQHLCGMDRNKYPQLKGHPPIKLLIHTALHSSMSSMSQSSISVLSAIRANNKPAINICSVMTPKAFSKPTMKQDPPSYQMTDPEISMNKEEELGLDQNVTSPLYHTPGTCQLMGHKSRATRDFNQNLPLKLPGHYNTSLPAITSVQPHMHRDVSEDCSVHFIPHDEPLYELKEAKVSDSATVPSMKHGTVEKRVKYKVHHLKTLKPDLRAKKRQRQSKDGSDGAVSLTECDCLDLSDREEIPEEQVFVVQGQMYRLLEAYVVHIGHLQLYAFLKEGSLFVPLVSLTSYLDMPSLERFNKVFDKYKASLIIADMFENDCELIRQKCHLSFSRQSKYMIEFSSIRALANIILQACDNLVMDCLVNKPVMMKVASSKVLCSQCGSVVLTTNQMDVFVDISMETSLLGHPIVLEGTLENDKTRKRTQSQQCTWTSAINGPISTHLEPADVDNVTNNGTDIESITNQGTDLSNEISLLPGENYTTQKTEIFKKCYVKGRLQEANSNKEGSVYQLLNEVPTNETSDTIRNSIIDEKVYYNSTANKSAEIMKTKSSYGKGTLLENVSLCYNYSSQGNEKKVESAYGGAETFDFDESEDLLDQVCPDELALTQRTSESCDDFLLPNEEYIDEDISAFESDNADNQMEVVSKNNLEQERTFEIIGKPLVPDKIVSIDKQKDVQNKNTSNDLRSPHIIHTTSPANGHITLTAKERNLLPANGYKTSPVKDHLTSPVKDHITSPVMDHITSPAYDHITSPAYGHSTSPVNGHITSPTNSNIISPAYGHMKSPANGHITSPANGHITSPEKDQITSQAYGHITLPANGQITSPTNSNITPQVNGHITSPANGNSALPSNGHITLPYNDHTKYTHNDHIIPHDNDQMTSLVNDHITSPVEEHIPLADNDFIKSKRSDHIKSPLNNRIKIPDSGHIAPPVDNHITYPVNHQKKSPVMVHKKSPVNNLKKSPESGNIKSPKHENMKSSESENIKLPKRDTIKSSESDEIKSPAIHHISPMIYQVNLPTSNDSNSSVNDEIKQYVDNQTKSPVKCSENGTPMESPRIAVRNLNLNISPSMIQKKDQGSISLLNMLNVSETNNAAGDNDTENVNRDKNKDHLKPGKKGGHDSEAERRVMEEKIKKYVVFVPRKNGFQVKRFKEGAEHAFPALFSPHPDYHMTKDLRRRFSIAASCWMSAMVKRCRKDGRSEHTYTVNENSMLLLKRKALKVPCFVQIKRLKFLDKLFE